MAERRRRLLYMEKGEPFLVPKSTVSRKRKQRDAASFSGESMKNDAQASTSTFRDPRSADCDESGSLPTEPSLGSAPLEEETPEGGFSDVGESDSDSSDSEYDFDPVMESEDILAAGLRAFGSETLPHSSTTKAAAVAMVMSFMTAHGLTWAALDDLLKLINTLFAPAADVLPRSKYLFRKLWLTKAQSAVAYHFYCKFCNDELKGAGDDLLCPTCDRRESKKFLKREGSFFIMLDAHEQLKYVIQRNKKALHNSLQKIVTSSHRSDSMCDITEAKLYTDMRAAGTLGSSDVTINLNTDGSPVFSSSGASIWPIQMIVNELPPALRFQNCTLMGLWFGKEHPCMSLFLEKFVDGLTGMAPVLWKYENTLHQSRAFVLCCCVDAPARALVQNCVLFNGYFGCPWCLIKGEMHDGKHEHLSLKVVH